MDFGNSIVLIIGDLISAVINVIAKKFGHSEVKEKQIKAYIERFVLLFLVAVICFITFKYS